MPEWNPPVRFAALAQAYPGNAFAGSRPRNGGGTVFGVQRVSVMGRYPAGLCMKPMGLPLIRRWETM